MYDKKDLNRKTYDITASWAGPNMQNGGIKKKILYLHTCEIKIFFPTPLYILKKIKYMIMVMNFTLFFNR